MNIIKIFKALSDETRLRIFRVFLSGIFNVNEILFIIGGKQSNISHHLKILQDAGLIINKKEGAQVYYRLNDFEEENIKELINLIKSKEKDISFSFEDSKHIEALIEKREKIAKEYFDTIGEEFNSVQEKLFEDVYSVKEAISHFKDGLNTILDIGCGTGRNLPLLSKYSKKVLGIDSSPKMIQLSEHICVKNNLNYELKIGDVNSIPYDSQSIDGVFANMVLHHISDPFSAIKEFERILIKNGNLILIDLLSHEDELMREKYADLWLGFSYDEISNWLLKSGFLIKEKIIKGYGSKSKEVLIIIAEKK